MSFRCGLVLSGSGMDTVREPSNFIKSGRFSIAERLSSLQDRLLLLINRYLETLLQSGRL